MPLFSTAQVPTPARVSPLLTAPQNPRTSSAANGQGASFLMFSVSESKMMTNRKGLKAAHWWRPTSPANGPLVPSANLTTVSHCWYAYMSFTSLMYTSLAPPCISCTNRILPSGLCRMVFLFNEHSDSFAVLLCIFLAAILVQNYISCEFSLHESKLFFTYAHDVSQSILEHSLV